MLPQHPVDSRGDEPPGEEEDTKALMDDKKFTDKKENESELVMRSYLLKCTNTEQPKQVHLKSNDDLLHTTTTRLLWLVHTLEKAQVCELCYWLWGQFKSGNATLVWLTKKHLNYLNMWHMLSKSHSEVFSDIRSSWCFIIHQIQTVKKWLCSEGWTWRSALKLLGTESSSFL